MESASRMRSLEIIPSVSADWKKGAMNSVWNFPNCKTVMKISNECYELETQISSFVLSISTVIVTYIQIVKVVQVQSWTRVVKMKQVDANVFLIWSVLVSIGSSSCQPSSDSQIPSNTKYKFYISHEYRHQTHNITSDQVVKVEVTDTQQAPICRIDNGQGMVLKWSDGDSSKIRAPDCRNKTS